VGGGNGTALCGIGKWAGVAVAVMLKVGGGFKCGSEIEAIRNGLPVPAGAGLPGGVGQGGLVRPVGWLRSLSAKQSAAIRGWAAQVGGEKWAVAAVNRASVKLNDVGRIGSNPGSDGTGRRGHQLRGGGSRHGGILGGRRPTQQTFCTGLPKRRF